MRLLSSIIKGARVRDSSIIEIKNYQYPVTPNGPVTFSDANDETISSVYDVNETLKKAKEEAQAIIEQASLKANQIIQDALNKIKIQEEESEKYSKQIIEEARNRETAILEEAKSKAEMMIKEAEKRKKSCIAEAEKDMVQMIVKIVGHVISQELVDNTDWVGLLVKRMIDTENISDNVEVFVPRKVYTQLTSEDIKNFSNDKVTVTIKEDETLDDAKIVLVTQQGNIEYDVQAGLKKVIHDIKVLQSI